MFPAIDPDSVGFTGLLWLLISYGYVLYTAANLISEGSDLLMLIPQISGVVGSVILPLLGAVPDGAIMLFSGLGDIETVQETLSVGVGALAGSTVMLLTVPWSLCIFSGRVKYGLDNKPNYRAVHKLNPNVGIKESLLRTGVIVSSVIKQGAVIMVATTIPYLLIQSPASYYNGRVDDLAGVERIYAFLGFLLCIAGFIAYLMFQFKTSDGESSKLHRAAIMKKMLEEGQISLQATLYNLSSSQEQQQNMKKSNLVGNTNSDNDMEYFAYEILFDQFKKYDKDKNGYLDFDEVLHMFKDYDMKLTPQEAKNVFQSIDESGDGKLSFDEVVRSAIFVATNDSSIRIAGSNISIDDGNADHELSTSEEEEDMPEDIASLPPDDQQAAIIKKSIKYMVLGTLLVLIFSDPMVDVLQELAYRINVSPFYVSFVLAPIAANASEIISSVYYARKKTSKSISVALSTLEGAAAMNNTFCLSILLGLIYFRNLVWEYTAETIAIITAQLLILLFTRKKDMRMIDAVYIFCIFPLSIMLVATLEYFGLD